MQVHPLGLTNPGRGVLVKQRPEDAHQEEDADDAQHGARPLRGLGSEPLGRRGEEPVASHPVLVLLALGRGALAGAVQLARHRVNHHGEEAVVLLDLLAMTEEQQKKFNNVINAPRFRRSWWD